MYAVIGGSGFLGRYAVKNILEKTTDDVIVCARNNEGDFSDSRVSVMQCDIADREQFSSVADRLFELGGEELKVIFLAAYHHPELVAKDPAFAWGINVTALSECVTRLRGAKRLFYSSTDSVYGNSEESYAFKETDQLSPVNEYGRQKAAAEAVVRFSGFNVVRFPFLISPSLVPGREHFYDRLCASLRAGEEIKMFSDSYRSSLTFDRAAGLMIDLCELDEQPAAVMNVCGDRGLSKYDVGLLIADKIGADRGLVRPIKMAEDKEFSKGRALSTLMDNSLLKRTLGLDEITLEL
ncbi:MAG: sugar nucleotide-binding protein [Ruminococcus sp.]|nr:sugar nucleotide-binding protein [Ruminococcus sp.]